MHKKAPLKPVPMMERRVPKSDKYSHVQSRLDTGLTVDKVKSVSAREYAKRRDETFFRLTRNQLYELYNEYEAEENECISESVGFDGGGPRIVTYSDSALPVNSKPYLILDVREQEEYNACHLMQARSYPSSMMRRDYTHPEVINFKNKPDMLIIVYCDDERISKEAAHVLVGRGADNVFLLTGGLNEFGEKYDSFVEGTQPIAPLPLRSLKPSGHRGSESGRLSTGHLSTSGSERGSVSSTRSGLVSSTRSGLGSSDLSRLPPTGKMTQRGDDCRSDSGMSSASNGSVAESIISRAVSRKGKY